MLIVVDNHSGVPVYRQIIDQVRFHIASGLLKPGDALPSTRRLAAELEVNPMTISKAYSLLERDGIVDRRRGRPLTVRADTDHGKQGRAHLRDILHPVVTVVRQLGIEAEDAVEVFRDLLGRGENLPSEEERS